MCASPFLLFGEMTMLDLELLNLAVLEGCSRPGCNHRSHDKIFFHAKCHPAAGLILSYPQPGVLHLDCVVCKDNILKVAVAETTNLRPRCHPNAPVWVSFKRGTGK